MRQLKNDPLINLMIHHLLKIFLMGILTLQAEDNFKDPISSFTFWDKTVNELTQKSPLFDRGANRLNAYLFHAQKIAYAQKENLDSVSLHIIQLFYPTCGQGIFSDQFNPLAQRFRKEQSLIHPIILKHHEGEWVGEVPYEGLEIPTWKPWVLKSADQFRLPKPPSDNRFWEDQLAQVKTAMQRATEEQKKQILFWQGTPDPLNGDWVVIVNEYMRKKKTPLEMQIQVRDAIGRVIVDATIAAFDTKYTYLIKRPNMLDPELKTYIPTPNHPSFPSAHSTVSAAVGEVLNHYLPENKGEWNRLLEEAGMSRIWAGIHFPIDHEQGKILGKQVGQALISSSLSQK